MPGLLDALQGMGSNPLIGMGAGLLGASGYSPYPVSMGQAMGQGLLGMQRASQMGERQGLERDKLGMQREEQKRKAEAAKQAAAAAAAKRTATIQAMIARGMPQAQAEMLATAGAAGDYLKPPPAPAQPPSSVQEALWLQSATPEQRAAFEAAQAAGASRTTIQNMPSPGFRSTPGGGTAIVTPLQGGGADVREIIPGVPEGERVRQRSTAEQEEAMRGGVGLIQNYMRSAGDYQSQPNPLSITRDDAKQARKALVTWVASNVLGEPGREPTPDLYTQAEDMVPDFAGWWDAPRFSERMAALNRTIAARFGGQAGSPAPPVAGQTMVPLGPSEVLTRDQVLDKYGVR